MNPAQTNIYVDWGNSRMKWGYFPADSEKMVMVSLEANQEQSWKEQVERWHLKNICWIVASVVKLKTQQFLQWCDHRQESFILVDKASQLSLPLDLQQPETVGIDRVLNAMGVLEFLRPLTGHGDSVVDLPSAVIVDIGTATTIDLLRGGCFLGGAILPGPRLMAQSLHQFTAALPDIACDRYQSPPLIGKSTSSAIHCGIMAAQRGALEHLVRTWQETFQEEFLLFLTGGGLGELQQVEPWKVTLVPELTLLGLHRHVKTLSFASQFCSRS